MCLKSNEKKTSIAEKKKNCYRRKKALLFMMSQCLMVSKTKFQHSVTTTFVFGHFSVKALSLWPLCENLMKLRIFGFFFLWCERWASNNKSPKISCPSRKNSNWSTKVASRSLWWWHNAKNSSFWVAQEMQRGKRGGGRWSQEWEVIHKQNRWKCWLSETKGAERSLSYCWNDSRWAG